MPAHALENGPVVDHIPVSISSLVWVFNRLHGETSNQNRGSFHRTCDLIKYIVDCIPIAYTAALIDVAAKENYLGYH